MNVINVWMFENFGKIWLAYIKESNFSYYRISQLSHYIFESDP